MEGYHKSVLAKEVLDILNIKQGSWYLDCTLGDGGHSLDILQRKGKVVGIDVDSQALERARERFLAQGFNEDNFILIKGNFRDINNLIQPALTPLSVGTEVLKFAGAIFDLGVSSLQLESPERGFSFGKAGPLDMRMDPSLGIKASDLIKVLSRKELYELFQNLGEEKYSKRLADHLVRAREIGKEFKETKDLAEFIVGITGWKKGEIHPATRVFQALRIAVNDELGALTEGLEQVKDLIEKGGKIVVISFHSLEDRIVKRCFLHWHELGIGEILTKKPVTPADEEIKENPKSRSAKMRIFKII